MLGENRGILLEAPSGVASAYYQPLSPPLPTSPPPVGDSAGLAGGDYSVSKMATRG